MKYSAAIQQQNKYKNKYSYPNASFSAESMCGRHQLAVHTMSAGFYLFSSAEESWGHEPIRAARGEEQGRPRQLNVRSFHNGGWCRISGSLYLNPLLMHTGRQMTPLFSTSSAAVLNSDKKKFTAERRDVEAELPMTHGAGIRRRDMQHIQSNLIT